MKRISSLDGLRAISIILVLISHCRFSNGFPNQFDDIARHGAVGVTVFFVISGFLITTLLLNEDAKDGVVNVKKFYKKRAFRILPVFISYTLLVIICSEIKKLVLTNNDIVHALTFTFNFAPKEHSWFLAHFWTLSVEEQFYLLWPTAFIIFRKHLKTVVYISISYSIICRVLVYEYPLYDKLLLSPYFSYSDAIMIGAFGAILLFENPSIIEMKIWRSSFLQIAALAMICLFVYFSGYGKFGKFAVPFGNLIISSSILFLIFSYIKPSNSLVFKFLNSKIIVHIGILSYSLYVWQQFFFTGSNAIWRTFPYNLLVIYGVSLISYYLIEQPFLKLRELIFNRKKATAY
jgi:peptidoglycan/LPS O-acetylase OafA/YrhL